MSMSASEIFDIIAPALASNAGKANHLALAVQRTNPSAFGENYTLAVALRAAHTLTMVGLGGIGGGAVSSKREGDLAVTYHAPTVSNPDLSGTSYGQQLLGLINGNIPAIGVTGGLDDGSNTTIPASALDDL